VANLSLVSWTQVANLPPGYHFNATSGTGVKNLPLVTLIPGLENLVHLDWQISPRIFENF
jgi:hypothetical protein